MQIFLLNAQAHILIASSIKMELGGGFLKPIIHIGMQRKMFGR